MELTNRSVSANANVHLESCYLRDMSSVGSSDYELITNGSVRFTPSILPIRTQINASILLCCNYVTTLSPLFVIGEIM